MLAVITTILLIGVGIVGVYSGVWCIVAGIAALLGIMGLKR